ncbi:OprD family porin [Pseudomonas sp. LRF_L74]|uniref:OprD family porin n=1 Tax=Pseudomonas sp. LRF_L74 TaxID=3369422 RepID=UPI003F60C862
MDKTLSLLGWSVSALLMTLSTSASADFLADSSATLGLRNFYFNNDYRDQPGGGGQSKTEEWGQGFMLKYSSGFTEGTVGFGVDALGLLGITLDSGGGRHLGSSMIPNDGEGAVDQWARLGLTAKMRFAKTEARYGSVSPKLPILQTNDGRLLPQTFEGAMLTSNDIDNLTINAGRLEHATGRGSSDRTALAVGGGSQASNEFLFAGADYKIGKGVTLQYYVANLEDYYTQNFVGVQHLWTLGESQSFKTDLRYFDSRSSGANGNAAGRSEGYRVGGYSHDSTGEIDNRTWSALFTYSLGGHAVTAGYQSVSSGSNFVQLNQGSLADKGSGGSSIYLFTDRILASFNRAGERTWFGQYAYDFSALGVPGLTASMVYLKGDNIQTTAGSSQSEWERDLSLDYVIQSGTLKGLGVGLRSGEFHSQADANQDQTRIIVSYNLALF